MTRRRESKGSAVSTKDRWILSYADFITLMFAFFTTFYAASLYKPAEATSGRGVLPGGRGVLPGGRDPVCSAGLQACLDDVKKQLQSAIDMKELRLTEDRRGLVLSIPEAGAFPAGSADISPAASDLISRIAGVLHTIPNSVRVEGHTDGTPIHTARFASNWELSTARATSVVEFFIERSGIAAERLSAAGYAEFHPVADNGDAAARFRNRRVDIIILNGETKSAEEPR